VPGSVARRGRRPRGPTPDHAPRTSPGARARGTRRPPRRPGSTARWPA